MQRQTTEDQLAKGSRLTFGLERIGLISVMWPLFTAIAVVLVTLAAVHGYSRIKVDDSLSELFRTDTPAFRDYEEMSSRFPSSEFDVLIVVEGATLLERQSVEKLRDVVINLNFLTSMKGLVSLFSARQPPKPGVVPPPLFPAELPEGEAYDQFVKQVRANEIIKGKLLSDDGTLALIVLALDPKVVASEGLGAAVNEIRREFDALNDTGLRVRLSGAPVMQQEIRDAVERDRLVYNGLGFALGTLIAILFFRRVSLMVIAATPPVVAIFWSLGTFGLIEFKLNLFLNVMSPLVMVLGFSDSMQLTFAIRDRLIAGYSRPDAIRYALLVVGPACVLSSATAAASFITLFASDSSLIRTFGAAGAISTLIAYIASITLVPLLATFLLRDTADLAAKLKVRDPGIAWLKGLCGWIAVQTTRRPGLFFSLGLASVIGFGSIYLSLDPRYRLADQVPDQQEAVAASGSLDLKLTGANPLEVMIEWPQARTLYDDEVIDVVGKVHRALESQRGVGNVWSVETLKRWLIESGDWSLPVLKEYIDILPEHLVGRFINFKAHSALVSGRIPDIDASEILPVIEDLDRQLQTVREAHPGFRIVATGLSAVAARNSASMIENLNMGLTIEMLFISACLGLVFRSALVAGVSLLPNLFPIFTAGAFLAATGAGLQFASIIALTIAFGLALNAAVHYFNRLRLEQKPGDDPSVGVTRATVLIGPALVLTTMVLVIGLGVTIFSGLPSLRTFGELTALALVAGLIGDLFILPATIMLAQRALSRLRG